MDIKKVDLNTINNGAAVELFNEEFDKVLRNINDLTVDSDATREIHLTVKIKPSRDRSTALTTVKCSSKIVSAKEHESSMFLSCYKNGIEAYVTNPHQQTLDFTHKNEESKPEIHPD